MIRHAIRSLRNSPAYTVAAVATLALAIGANTTMFSVLNAVLFRPLAYRSPETLALLWAEDPSQNLREGRSALWDVEQWRRHSQSFADMATFDAVSMTFTPADGAEQIVGASISPNLLSLIGVEPVLGRSFLLEESEQPEQRVLISHRFWQTRFGGSSDAVGARIMLDGRPAEIIGVLPPAFQIARLDADVWTSHPAARESVRGQQTWFVIARLRQAVTVDQAQAEMSALAGRLNDQLAAAERNRGISVVPLSQYMVGRQARLALWILGGAVFCVFLIAAANVAGLSLARSADRGREMAVRMALGASRGQIARHVLTESILLAVVSGLAGILLGFIGIRLVRAFGPDNLPRLNEMGIDLRVLSWSLAVSAFAGILAGLSPAMATVRRDLRLSVEGGGGRVAGGAASSTVRRALVVAEFALAIVLLAGAGLLVRSWWYVNTIDPGFNPQRVMVLELSSPPTLTTPAQRIDLYRRVLEETQAVAGVERAGIIDDLFIDNSREQILTVDTNAGLVSERLRLTSAEVSADFFKTVGTPLLRGRFFSAGDDAGGPPVAMVNDTLARRSWPGQDPIGRRFRLGAAESAGAWYTVVGVIGDMRRQGPEREPLPQVFRSLAQDAPRSVDLFIRVSADEPVAMAGAIQAAVRRVEKDAPIYGIGSLDQRFGTYGAQRRFQTALLAGFAVVALLMAAVGIYGLIQYSIATRVREIGLRMAVGAQAADIFRMVIGQGLRLSLTGLGLGLLAAWWLSRVVSNLLFGVTASDPLTFIAISIVMTAAATAACYFPARRAMKVDPIVALRIISV
jgi:putative ABC transport system permease protein